MSKGLVMSNADYRKAEGISSSELKKIMKSPLHYKHYKDNPEETDTPSLLFGRAAHKYILETYDFYKEFAVAPNFDRRTKEGKAQWSLFCDENEGKDIITQEQFEQIDAMRTAAYATPFVSKLMNGDKELSFWGVDEETGLKIKCRPDCITEWNGKHILIDFKTATDVENMKFYRDSIKFGYDLQLAMYRDILMQNTGHEYLVVIIAQEKTAPYATNVFQLSENYLENGRELYKEMLRVYKQCSESGVWYGYMKDGISILGQPDDEDMEEGAED